MAADLFSADDQLGEPLGLECADLTYLRPIALPSSSATFLNSLIAQNPWREEEVLIYGKKYQQPKLIAWYSGLTVFRPHL
jgi:hypothetical protein